MSPDDDLRVLQGLFRGAVLGADNGALAVHIAPEHAARIDVYRNTVQESLIDVLATAFPVVRRIVGADFFKDLAQRYIAAMPPRLAHLSAYGDGFARFIAGAPIGTRLAYLPDVARLEWARGEAYFAADAAPLDTARLAALSPAAMEAVVLKLHPATRMLVSAYPIYRIWSINQPEVTEVPHVDMSVSQTALVSRKSHHIVTREIQPADAAFLTAITDGKSLADAASAAAAVQGDFDLQAALQHHFINGTFRELTS